MFQTTRKTTRASTIHPRMALVFVMQAQGETSMLWCTFYTDHRENIDYPSTCPPDLAHWSWESSASRKSNRSPVTFRAWRTYIINEEKPIFSSRFVSIMKQFSFIDECATGKSPSVEIIFYHNISWVPLINTITNW